MCQPAERDQWIVYRIRVKGVLEAHWSDWFGGMTVSPQANGETVLVGPVRDQSALHGILFKIGSLGLPLLSLSRTESDSGKEAQPGGI